LSLPQSVARYFDQLGQQEGIVLEKGIGRHFPARRRTAQNNLEPPFRRGVRPDVLELLVKGWLCQSAFFHVHHQPAVRPDKADIQTLLEFVPLAANHDAIPIPVGLRAGNDRRDESAVKVAQALKQIPDLFMLKPKLGGVSQVLILAAAARAEVSAARLDPFRGRFQHPQQPGPGIALLQLRYFRFHQFAHGYEGDENHEIFPARHTFAPEGQIADPQAQLVAQRQIHASERGRTTFRTSESGNGHSHSARSGAG